MIKALLLADQVQKRIRELGTDSPLVLKAIDAFARVVRSRVQVGFRMAKAPDGTPWAKLNPFFRVGQPLRNTNRLYGSIQTRREGGAVVLGTNLRTPNGRHNLGAIHQFGANVTPTEGPGETYRGRLLGPIPTAAKGFVFLRHAVIPARPFFPLDRAGRVALPQAWANSALSAMARALELDK